MPATGLLLVHNTREIGLVGREDSELGVNLRLLHIQLPKPQLGRRQDPIKSKRKLCFKKDFSGDGAKMKKQEDMEFASPCKYINNTSTN